MERKEKKGTMVAIVILAILIVLGLGVCLALNITQKTGKIKQDISKKETEMQTESAAEEVEEEAESLQLESFAVGTKKVPEVPKEDEQNGEYLCTYSSERLLTEADVQELQAQTYENLPEGKNILQMVINEMYAKYGYQFTNEEIQKFFEQKEWYQKIEERNTDMEAIHKEMTEIEKENIDFLTSSQEEEE